VIAGMDLGDGVKGPFLVLSRAQEMVHKPRPLGPPQVSTQQNLLRKVKRKLLFPTGFSFYLVLIIFVYTKKADFQSANNKLFICFVL
jgi:hypothetical protein